MSGAREPAAERGPSRPAAGGAAGRGLVRRLSRLDGLAIGVGSVVGVGIFRTTGDVVRSAGGVAGATAVWLGLGLLSLVGARVYAAMALRVPEAGGPYAYVREAFGRPAAFVDGWLGAAVSSPARQAASMAVIGEVVGSLTGISNRLCSLMALGALLVVNLAGVRAGALTQRVLTSLKLVIVAGVIVLAVHVLGHYHDPAPLPPALPLAAGVAGAWYAYLGWQDTTHLVEELEDPRADLGVVLTVTVVVVIVVYLALASLITLALGGGAAARDAMPVRALASAGLGPRGEVAMRLAVLVSMIGGAAEGMMVRPRLFFALGRDGLAPRWLAGVDATGAPRVALVAHATLILVILLSGGFERLLSLVVLSQALGAAIEAAAGVVLARRETGRIDVAAAAFFAVNAAVAAAFAIHEPAQIAYTIAAVAVLGLAYLPLARAAARRGRG